MLVNFGKILLQQVQQDPNRLALANVERKRFFTFKELHLLTNKSCNMMRDEFDMHGGDIFATLLENDNNSLFSFWTGKVEASGLWLNYRDSFDEHLYHIDFLKPKLIFIEKEMLESKNYYEALRHRGIEMICMDKPSNVREGIHYFWDLIDAAKEDEVDYVYDIDKHITHYRFTGGTTGRGKCAMYTLRNTLNAVYQTYAHPENYFDGDANFLHMAPITHATATFVMPVYFKGGANYTINSTDLIKFSEAVEKYKITSSMAVPTLLYRLNDSDSNEKYDLSSLDKVFYGGAPMSPAKLESLQNKFGNIFIQLYGSTEAWPHILFLGKSDHLVKSEADKRKLASSGRPLLGVEIEIVDAEGQEVQLGDIGEIWIRGASVINCYYNSPEESAAGFSEDGFWKSGDMGYMDEEGYIYIVDRKKDMIISGGFNIYAIEVENALNSHPAVQQSVVVGVPHEEWGEAVHAEVILKADIAVSEDELIQFVKMKISYKAPKTIAFVSEFPVSSVGKVLRRKVRDVYWRDQTRKI